MTAEPKRTAWNSTLPARTARMSRTPWTPQPDHPWSSLSRSTGLAQRAPRTGGVVVPLRPGRQRPATLAAAFSPQVRQAIRDRAANACEACAVHLGPRAGELQHRVCRGMGGSRNPVLGSVVNGVLLCAPCHAVAESRDRKSRAQGFWLRRYEDPAAIPIMLHGGSVELWLTEAGSYSTERPLGVA